MNEQRDSFPYWDKILSMDQRVEDLIQRMKLEEKCEMMFQDMIVMRIDGALAPAQPHFGMLSNEDMVHQKGMNHFNFLEALGLAALRSTALVEKFANVTRQEYLAIGLRLALHPQVDLATEPRWSRIGATFGEDSELMSKLVAAYIRGFQGATLGPNSVSTMTKHFPGGGPQKDGEDPHFAYGQEQDAGAAQIMHSYGMPVGTKYEEVGFAFNKAVITAHASDVALLRLKAPFTPRTGAFESLFHAGSLEYTEEEKGRRADIFETVPTVIVDMYVDRPPVIPEVVQRASALLFSYGSTADAFLDFIFGVYRPEGRLSFDLPSSTIAVYQSQSDMSYDTKDPLFRFGHGLCYGE
ncbi:uncharacterized protein N7496_001210 [Penicillium cataractarum]|uniref:beta-glucosidase n=1 Tax=Penicillium cataractarum TaxID=2100454 RepID=A0A9X0B6V5_9EURO|nr:uncharacterized protein N7496_001210 [Penicillium cataractarum]KAJ5390142.1 hypothetical protein N7496_001210 [Penicillium cataractarum]